MRASARANRVDASGTKLGRSRLHFVGERMTTQRKLLLLGSLYLAQGLPYGFFTQALPVLLRESGMSLPRIGLTGLLALPWALKFLWAPLVDSVQAPRLGKRRAVITPLQLANAAVLATLALAADPAAMWPLFLAVLLVNLFSATQDIATDGLAVEVLGPSERGLGNGLQVGAYRLGMIIGGGAILWVLARLGWSAAFLIMAGLVLFTTAPVLLLRETPVTVTADNPAAGVSRWRTLLDALKRPGLPRWLTVLVTFKTGEWFATGMLKTFLSDSKQSLADIGLMLGVVGFSAAFAGSMLGGGLTATLGRRRALISFGLLQTVAVAAMAIAVAIPTVPVFYAVTVLEHFASGMATAALFTAMMDFSRQSEAGTDYTVQASIVVIAAGVASGLSGLSADALGYGGHFLLASFVSLLGVAAVVTYRPGHRDFAFVGSNRGGPAVVPEEHA